MMIKDRSYFIGVVPTSGVIDNVWNYMPTAPSSKLLIFQARVVDFGLGLVQRSNSIDAVVN